MRTTRPSLSYAARTWTFVASSEDCFAASTRCDVAALSSSVRKPTSCASSATSACDGLNEKFCRRHLNIKNESDATAIHYIYSLVLEIKDKTCGKACFLISDLVYTHLPQPSLFPRGTEGH